MRRGTQLLTPSEGLLSLDVMEVMPPEFSKDLYDAP